MEKLKFHSDGKEAYQIQLETDFQNNLKEIENDKRKSKSEKDEAIRLAKKEYQKLKTSSEFGLY